jgi:hypothetical protein
MQDTKTNHGLELLKGLDYKTPIHGIVRSVSASGMSRNISLKVVKDGQLLDITYSAGELLGYKVKNWHGFNALSVHGAGMDMVFHLVYSLGETVHGDGYYFRSEII